MILLKSFSLKSGHNLSIKNISVYAICHNKKLLNLFVPPVLIKISGSGISRVYSSFSKLFMLISLFFLEIRFINPLIISSLNYGSKEEIIN